MQSRYFFDNKALITLIVPLIIEQLLSMLVGMADSIMIANVGETAVSGVSLVEQIIILIINAFSALATGGTIIAGQYLGHEVPQKACESATQLVWFVTLCSIIVTASIYAGKSVILHKMFGQVSSDVMYHANTYFTIVIISIPFIAMYNAGTSIFRTMGNSKVPMAVSVIMNILNVSGNALLIYGFHRGTEGVAFPTLISRMFAALTILILLCNEDRTVHIKKAWHYRIDWAHVKRILSLGIPNGLEDSLFQLGKLMVLSLIAAFGTHEITANAVSNSIILFQLLPGLSINLAVITVIARCTGAGDYEQAEYYNRKLLIITHICITITVLGTFMALPYILKIYKLSKATASITRRLVYLHGISAMLIWPASFTLPATFRAAGDVKLCMGISMISMWTFRIGFSCILGKYMGMGVLGVWTARIIDWGFRAFCFSFRYFSGKWKKSSLV